MAAKIRQELSVGVTDEIALALRVATERQGLKQSQYCRMAILQRLVNEGFLRMPGVYHQSQQADQ
jgi:hypothetical protein